MKSVYRERCGRVLGGNVQEIGDIHKDATVPPEYEQILAPVLAGNKSLYLHGGIGSGKTHLAVAVIKRLALACQYGKMITAAEMFAGIRREIEGESHQTYNLAMQYYPLVIDDIGAERSTDWVREQLDMIVDYRYRYDLQTIYTSNLSLGELHKTASERVASRLSAMCIVLKLSGDDRRLK